MKKLIAFLILFSTLFILKFAFSHVNHYSNLKHLEYEIFLNNDLIGKHTFNFSHDNEILNVKSEGNFIVKKLGLKLIDYKTKTHERYKKGKLIAFNSKTIQNEKRKFVNLNLNLQKQMLEIDGSSFKGSANTDYIVGSWWNHEIINKKTQMSAISGRILPQKVNFLGKEIINLSGKEFEALSFHFLSNDDEPIEKKKINFNIWYDKNTLLWLKMSYEKLGLWEYRLKNYSFY